MKDLEEYVDGLFAHQRQTAEVVELKEEIVSNMEAKRADLVAQGLTPAEATQRARESLVSVEGLIEGTQLTYIDRYRAECLQDALLASAIFWIFSMPLLFTGFAAISFGGLLATAGFAAAYLVKRASPSDAVAFVSQTACRRRTRLAWRLWGLFFLVCCAGTAALSFGSAIWFGRPVTIDGPYQFAAVAARFYAPLLTIVIPITIGGCAKRLTKHEKRDV